MEKATDKDFQVALCELQVSGLIEFMPDNAENFFLTEKGTSYGKGLIDKLPLKDRLVLFIYKDERIDASLEDADGEEE